MSSLWRSARSRASRGFVLRGAFAIAAMLLASLAACGGEVTPPDNSVQIASIVIDGGARILERGSVVTLTATAKDRDGNVVNVPFAWRSTNDSIASFEPNGRLVAKDTGTVGVTASALGVTSGAVQIVVRWTGPAKITALPFAPPTAITPGATLNDSIRVQVTNLVGGPSAGAIVLFTVTGGGSVSPARATTGANGVASTKWTLGPTAGVNTLTATVVDSTNATITWVQDNPVSFSVKSYAALTVLAGDGQSGSLLSALPVAPIVKLVDSAGKPRAGVPITFTASHNGRVASPIVSTNVDGIASPGAWTLGDTPGEQQLVASVENASITLRATATGSAVRFPTVSVATAQQATCALTSDQFVSCMGQPPQIGTGDSTNAQSTPTRTAGGVRFTSLVGGSAHFCGTSTDLSIYCWGINATVDTSGVVTSTRVPTRLASNVAWVQVAPGGQHNCALANDGTAYCWGIDTSGQLGDNAVARRFVPQPVAGGFKFRSITAGAAHSCGITEESSAFCWGSNASGQLGDGTTLNRLTPTAVTGAIQWKALAAGANWTCGLSTAGTAHCWGAGTGRTVPIPYPDSLVFASLSVGAAHACALTQDGRAYCWGDNSSGQLGDSTTVSRDRPAEVATEVRFSSISAGQQQTCAITLDGFLMCWGRNTVGELGFSNADVQLTPRYVVIGVQQSISSLR